MSYDDQQNKTEVKTGQAHVQRLVTGFGCEIRGCVKQGEWYITLDELSFHWCGTHTTQRMNDNKFWETQSKRKSR
ncbi:MAG: hypothetical protein OK455_06525 [Thaumarchaeota archaeon]|nr:hypothetical protein [Nitrososphaerota archaeon]